MKKRAPIYLMMMFCILATSLQAQQEVFRVKFSVTDANCYNNGKISYALRDANGEVLDTLPNGLSLVRAYYQTGPEDSLHYSGWYYSGGYDSITLNNGTYIVGVEGLLDDGAGGYIRVDTHSVLTINTSYQKLEAYSLGEGYNYHSSTSAGKRPTLSCINTGRIQMRIEKGRFPYKVTVLEHNTGDTLRTEIFHERQYSGTNTEDYDYQDFYTIDSLGAGLWDLYVEDGCGYGLPRIEESVTVSTMPIPTDIRLYSSSGNLADSNVVKVEVNFDQIINRYKPYLEQHARYRFVYEGLGASEWKPFDRFSERKYTTFFDTMFNAERYCELWNRNITFEYNSTCCENISRSFTFQILKPNDIFFEKESVNKTDKETISNDDSSCVKLVPWYRHYHSIRYFSNKFTPLYHLHKTTDWTDHSYYRYHYSEPITWIYTDMRNGNIIKLDTVAQIIDPSYLYRREVESLYDGNSDSISIPVERKLVDRKGCVLYTTLDTLTYPRRIRPLQLSWRISHTIHEDHCCKELQEVVLSCAGFEDFDLDSTVVRLIESPYNGRYNFEAVYHAGTESWEIHKNNYENGAEIIGHYDGRSISLKDYCLVSGPYTFEVTTSCGTEIISKNIAFPDIYGERTLEKPAYTVTQTCSNITVSYTGGSFCSTRFNTSLETGLPLDTVYASIPTKMTVVAAPSEEVLNTNGYVSRPFYLSQPGKYVIQIEPHSIPSLTCKQIKLYDTLDLGTGFVEFEYAKAILCDSSSSFGDVYVKGINGFKPYTYTLYSQPDKQGEVLGANNTGIFLNVPMRSDQMLSCLIQDSCTAYFHVNFYPYTIAEMQKVWFDGGLKVSTSCEGDTIQVHAISIGDILQYEWSGPNGFNDTTSDPKVFIPRGNRNGWFKVAIRNTGCSDVITDSIYLTVQEAPQITMAPDTIVCPGETVEVRFTAQSPANSDSVSFAIAFDNKESKEIRQYLVPNGGTVTDFYSTKIPAKIYPVSIDDRQCDYLLADPDDTIYISMRSDISAACQLLTSHDTVCYGSNAHLTAKASVQTPYLIRWYGDYHQTQWLKTDTIADSSSYSHYDTTGIVSRTMLFASVEENGHCPSITGVATDTMLIHGGNTTMSCGQVIRLFDSGGEKRKYGMYERFTHRFQSTDNTRISITFNKLNLTNSTHLVIFSGDTPCSDSVLYDLTSGSLNPGTVISKGNSLTLFFISNLSTAEGWDAWVECEPGIAIADVWRKNGVTIRDEVCQRQNGTYDDPYGVCPEVVSLEELSQAMRKAGNYYYTKTLSNSNVHNCDSIVHFEFIVNPPPQRDTNVFITSSFGEGFRWYDSTYTEGGHYAYLSAQSDGCDSLDILHLTVMEVNIHDHDICEGDTARLTVTVTTPERPTLGLQRANVGDVVCTDGSILPPDSFLLSGKTAKGVVFDVDASGFHGLIVSLSEMTQAFSEISFDTLFIDMYGSLSEAIFDMEGRKNTKRLVNMDESYNIHNHASKIPAVLYCHYYNHLTRNMDVISHGWYMPSLGEFNILISRCLEVNTTIRKLSSLDSNAKLISLTNHWTSSINDDNNVWMIQRNNGILAFFNSFKFTVRPISTF